MCPLVSSEPSERRHSEAELRAAVIVGILRFTSWDKTTKKEEEDLTVCLVGSPKSELELEKLHKKHQVNGRTLVIQHLKITSPKKELCEVIIFGGEVSRQVASSMQGKLEKLPVVTICDNCHQSIASKTLINLILIKQRIRFEADWVTARAKGVFFDASLLELATKRRKK